jgi:hypothetical protein
MRGREWTGVINVFHWVSMNQLDTLISFIHPRNKWAEGEERVKESNG